MTKRRWPAVLYRGLREVPDWVSAELEELYVRAMAYRVWFGPESGKDIVLALRIDEPGDTRTKAEIAELAMMVCTRLLRNCLPQYWVQTFLCTFEAAVELLERGFPLERYVFALDEIAAKLEMQDAR